MEPIRVTTTGASSITVFGSIKDIDDYRRIKNLMSDLIACGQKNITILIPDSVKITASVIGYFLKLIIMKNVDLSLQVKEDALYNFLHILSLENVLKVRRMDATGTDVKED